ncbi:ABC transporter ATP-binding protein [Nocardioides sp. SR21]|uniref:ABC transporter ATP-binding protein n=1 Tax=Nocardioides sp. SR21 TaxID=2919501 RepID=UPI001FAAA7C0|nr:ABC transporter ATP-binding protein [Nocardioides sp. SR21]
MSDVLAVGGLEVRLGERAVLAGVDLRVPEGAVVGLLGANGSGKSSLLRAVFRAVRPDAGVVAVDGADVWRDLSARAAARRTAAVTQMPGPLELSVREVVELGRAPHASGWGGLAEPDRAAVARAVESAGIAHLMHRRCSTLSGGERQRVLLARALAGEPRLLVLDEPTNHLDVAAQHDLLGLVRASGTSALVALHDLDLAGAYCDLVHVLAGGRVVAHGPVVDVLTPDLVRAVFGVDVHVDTHPLTGRPRFSTAPLTPTHQEEPR